MDETRFGRGRWLVLLGLVAAALLLGWFATTDPFNHNASWLPRCLFRDATGGYLCPGCGAGRATHSLMHGRLGLAFACNPLFVVALPLILIGLANELVRAVRGRPLWRWRLPAKVVLLIGFVVIAWWVVRNIPVEALDWMRPPTDVTPTD